MQHLKQVILMTSFTKCHWFLFYWEENNFSSKMKPGSLKVLGKSVGLCKTTKRKDQLYMSLLVSVW